MLNPLFVCGVLGALLIPSQSQEEISVCIEDDNDLRVDCKIKPKPNKIASYEFSWSSGTKETLLNTNVSGSSADVRFKDKSEVVELEPFGYRMTLKGLTDSITTDTTYMCKMSEQIKTVFVQGGRPETCSAVSVFLKSCWSWIACLLFQYHTRS